MLAACLLCKWPRAKKNIDTHTYAGSEILASKNDSIEEETDRRPDPEHLLTHRLQETRAEPGPTGACAWEGRHSLTRSPPAAAFIHPYSETYPLQFKMTRLAMLALLHELHKYICYSPFLWLQCSNHSWWTFQRNHFDALYILQFIFAFGDSQIIDTEYHRREGRNFLNQTNWIIYIRIKSVVSGIKDKQYKNRTTPEGKIKMQQVIQDVIIKPTLMFMHGRMDK